MKQGAPGNRLPERGEAPTRTDSQRIDAQYGLEPVIEVGNPGGGAAAAEGVEFHLVQCPYCGEHFETPIDTSAGSARYVEDCQVCCQPIEFKLEVDHEGVIQDLSTLRGD